MPDGQNAPKAGEWPLSFVRAIEQRLRDHPPARKGERTRLRLKAAAAALLEEIGYRAMRVSDICDAAGIGLATFYFHFENRAEITREVLAEFLEYVDCSHTRMTPPDADIFEAIRNQTWHQISLFLANAGLMRCLLILGDEEEGFRQLWERQSSEWYRQVERRLVRRAPALADDPDMPLTVRLLGGMVDEWLRTVHLAADGPAENLASAPARTPEDLAHHIATIYHRALFGRDPGSST